MGFNSGFAGNQLELAATKTYVSDTEALGYITPEEELATLEAVAESDLDIVPAAAGALTVGTFVEQPELIAA